jgi:hypothetical protein
MSTLVGEERRARIAVEGCVSVFIETTSFLSFPEPVKKAVLNIAGVAISSLQRPPKGRCLQLAVLLLNILLTFSLCGC